MNYGKYVKKKKWVLTHWVNSVNDSKAFSRDTFLFIRKCSYNSFSSWEAVFSLTEWHSGRKQTAKVIIICGHAAPHLTDGDNMSKHFSIKKENTNKQKGRGNIHAHIKGSPARGKKRKTSKWPRGADTSLKWCSKPANRLIRKILLSLSSGTCGVRVQEIVSCLCLLGRKCNTMIFVWS